MSLRQRRSHSHLKRLPRSSVSAAGPPHEADPRWSRAEWLAKAQAHALRMAGALEFLGWAFTGGNEPDQIGLQSVEAAARLTVEYFWPHSRACPAADRAFGKTRKGPAGSALAGSTVAREKFAEKISCVLSGRNHGRRTDPDLDRRVGESGMVRERRG